MISPQKKHPDHDLELDKMIRSIVEEKGDPNWRDFYRSICGRSIRKASQLSDAIDQMLWMNILYQKECPSTYEWTYGKGKNWEQSDENT